MRAKGPCASGEKRDHGDDAGGEHLTEQLVQADAVDPQVQQRLVETESAPLDDGPAQGRARIADVSAKRPAAIEQEAVHGADAEADRRREQIPNAEDLEQERVDGEREQRVRHADDPELHELQEQRRASVPGSARYAVGNALAYVPEGGHP